MKIIEPKVEIISAIDGEKMLKQIELAARNCYKSEDKITEDCSSAKKIITMLMSKHHEAMLEFADIIVRLTCDIGCYDKETYVLTQKGWKLFKDVLITDMVYTLDDNDKTILSPIKNIINSRYSGIMHRYKSTQIDLLVTPNHNMWITGPSKKDIAENRWKLIQSQDIKSKSIRFNKCGNFEYTIDKEPFVIPSVVKPCGSYNKRFEEMVIGDRESFFELLGWWITDGSLSKSGKDSQHNCIKIHQIKEKNRKRIEYLLNKCNLNYNIKDDGFSITNHYPLIVFLRNSFGGLFNISKKSLQCKIPEFIKEESSNNLEAFLNGVIGGNGTKLKEDGRCIIYSASEDFCRDIVEICFKLNKPCNYYPHPSLNKYPYSWKQNTITFDISIIKTKTSWFDKKNKSRENFKEEYYDDYIYCLELPKYHKLFVMRNGYSCWCGNSYKDLTRHRHCSFAIESTRYCNYSKEKFGNEITFIKPCNMEDNELYVCWEQVMRNIENYYNVMSKIGAKPDQLRMLLPHSTAASVVMKANIREWRHILRLRTSPAAHPSVQQIMKMTLAEFKKNIPVLFDDIGE